MSNETKGTILRWMVGWAFFGLAGWCIERGVRIDDFSLILCSVPLFLIGVMALWKTIFHVATRPFILMVDSLFFPGGELAKPVLNLKLPGYYIQEGRFDEALTEYRKILKHYPDEVEAYEKAIWLYVTVFEEPAQARRLVARAKRRNLTLDDAVIRHAKESFHLKQKTP